MACTFCNNRNRFDASCETGIEGRMLNNKSARGPKARDQSFVMYSGTFLEKQLLAAVPSTH
jgi:hypothetical protein